MVYLIVLGCVAMSYFFMAATAIFKGISSLIHTMYDMLDIWAVLLLGSVGIIVMEVLVSVFSGSFWAIILSIIVVVIVGVLVVVFFGFIGTILMYVVTFVLSILELVFDKLGDWCELGLKFFLGMINKKIFLS